MSRRRRIIINRWLGIASLGGGSTTAIMLSPQSIAEDAASGSVVGALTVVNGTGPYTFSITSDPDNKFAIDGTNLEIDATLDYETATSHQVTISAAAGSPIPTPRTFTISVTNVAEVEEGPTVLVLSPLDNATGVAIDAVLTVQFDVPVVFGDTVLIRLYETTGDVLVEEWDETDIGLVVVGDTLEIAPTADLDYEKSHYVTIAAGSVENAGGDPFAGISGTASWNFTTEDDPLGPVVDVILLETGTDTLLLETTDPVELDTTIPAQSSAGALGGTEVFAIVQGGTTKKITAATLAAYING